MATRDPPDEGDATPTSAGARGEQKPHDDFVHLFRRGLKFTEELLAENEKLRFRLATLEARTPGGADDSHDVARTIDQLKGRIAELEAERARLLDSFKQVETLNQDYQARYAEIEEEHNNLANLYIASYQLHSTLDFKENVRVIAEIVINLVGVHRFVLYLLDADSKTLHPVFAEGQDLDALPTVKLGEGQVGQATEKRETFIADAPDADPRAVVPLATMEGLVGAIVVNELLVQKPSFSSVDHELFTLLGAHAATALIGGLLRHQSADRSGETVLKYDIIRALLGL